MVIILGEHSWTRLESDRLIRKNNHLKKGTLGTGLNTGLPPPPPVLLPPVAFTCLFSGHIVQMQLLNASFVCWSVCNLFTSTSACLTLEEKNQRG